MSDDDDDGRESHLACAQVASLLDCGFAAEVGYIRAVIAAGPKGNPELTNQRLAFLRSWDTEKAGGRRMVAALISCFEALPGALPARP